ncbi:uncharacterized protein LOC128640402 [Bombina bombina]|uniref:uncharacterized protein LOC128640402 n=1 Tax=Bombina bombina TaxID=8345 RepID=UPI00235ACC84|nr:uncharacterized protein LOC128640402 [Bombina bombina]
MACYLGDLGLDDDRMEVSENPKHVLYQTVPSLTMDERYHIFISYSSRDSIWVIGLIHKLEKMLPSLQIGYHEKDFIPGRTIIDNMIDCIQKSKKILVVLSPDFVRSNWCLFETNLSMFKDCLGHKAIVPIMLKPCPVPLHLSHLTYIDAEDDQFFEKLINAILNGNEPESDEDVMFHYQSSILYNGKSLLTLAAVNENDLKANNIIFSDASVPDSLKAVVEDSDLYKEAIRILNATPTFNSIFNSKMVIVLLSIIFGLLFALLLLAFVFSCFTYYAWFLCLPLSFSPIFIEAYRFEQWDAYKLNKITKEMIKSTGRANLLLMKTSILAGYPSKGQLFFVYITCLKKCMRNFEITFGTGSALATAMWEKAIVKHSSEYACCLSRKCFPFKDTEVPSHLKGGVCFCQFVIVQIKNGDWP